MEETTKTLGMTLLVGAAGGTAATPVAGIASWPGMPDLNFDEYENTAVDQADLVKGWVMTLIDAGTLAPTLKMREDTVGDLYDLYDGEDRAWKIVFSSTATLEFEGPLKRIGMEAGGTNTEVLVPIAIRVNSMPEYTPAPPPPPPPP